MMYLIPLPCMLVLYVIKSRKRCAHDVFDTFVMHGGLVYFS